MSRRSIWTAVFLSLTGGAIGMELLAAFDDSPSTVPWTSYLISLPWWVLAPLVLAFVGWLPVHLWLAKKRREKRSGALGERP